MKPAASGSPAGSALPSPPASVIAKIVPAVMFASRSADPARGLASTAKPPDSSMPRVSSASVDRKARTLPPRRAWARVSCARTRNSCAAPPVGAASAPSEIMSAMSSEAAASADTTAPICVLRAHCCGSSDFAASSRCRRNKMGSTTPPPLGPALRRTGKGVRPGFGGRPVSLCGRLTWKGL